jgi:hypothetical protein
MKTEEIYVPVDIKISDHLAAKNTLSKAAHNNASQCGHPCLRFLFYRRHPDHWDKASRYTTDTLYLFWNGNEVEKSVMSLLSEAGMKVTNQQQYFYDESMDMSGMLDCVVDGIPTEVKAVQNFLWDKVGQEIDFLSFPDSQYYYRNYYHQMNMYLYLTNNEAGQFILFNKQNAKIKAVPFALNWDEAAKISDNMRVVNEALKRNIVPEQLKEGAIDICPKCPFYSHCSPAFDYGEGFSLDDIPEGVEEILDEMQELIPAHKRYNELDKMLKHNIKGRMFAIGKYIVSGKWVTRESYPPDKSQAPKVSEYWKSKITVIGNEDAS